ncbi:MAG: sulfurtransferase [Planctomycetota bacterium]
MRYLAGIEEVKSSGVLVIDARRVPAYDVGHIPRAVKLDIFEHHWPDTSPRGVKAFVWQMQEVMRRVGVTNSKRVVAYDDESGMFAARLAWVLDWLGHQDVAMLDGGMTAWVRSGGEISKGEVVPKRSAWVARPDASKMITASAIRRGLKRLTVVDTRTPEEHCGAHVRAARGGTIPGAIPVHYVDNLRGGKFKPVAELRAMYKAAGVTPDQDIVPLCNGGYRSAHTYFALRMCGYSKVRNYYAAWQEWGNLPGMPVAKK